MFSDEYRTRVNEIADNDGLTRGDQLRLQVFAGLDEVLVDVFNRPCDQWADALVGLDMPRCAQAVHRHLDRTDDPAPR